MKNREYIKAHSFPQALFYITSKRSLKGWPSHLSWNIPLSKHIKNMYSYSLRIPSCNITCNRTTSRVETLNLSLRWLIIKFRLLSWQLEGRLDGYYHVTLNFYLGIFPGRVIILCKYILTKTTKQCRWDNIVTSQYIVY